MAKTVNSAACFNRLQQAWRDASQTLWDIIGTLEGKYGEGNARLYAKKSELRPYEAAKVRQDKTSKALYAWLAQHSPRDWTSTVSMAWVRDRLTYDDAATSQKLSATPTPSYGYSDRDVTLFAEARISSQKA
jgi:hypothetical protein